MYYIKNSSDSEGFKLWSTKFHGLMTLPISLAGVLFNLLTIAIFVQKDMRSITNSILMGISVFDILLMVAYIPYAIYFYLLGSPDPVPGQMAFWPYYALTYSHLSLFAHGCSVWFTCFLAFYRYITVTSCVSRKSYNPLPNANRVRNAMIIIVLFVLCCMSVNVLCYQVAKDCFPFLRVYTANDTHHNVTDTYEVCVELINSTHTGGNSTFVSDRNEENNLTNNGEYASTTANNLTKAVNLNLLWMKYSDIAIKHPILSSINFWIHAIVFRTVPCMLLAIMSILLIYVMHIANKNRRRLMQQGKKSEYEKAGEFDRTTTMLLIVVISFLIMEFPHGILYIICGISDSFFRDVYVSLGDLLDLLVLINSSINFFLYCCMSSQFRDKFRQIFFSSCIHKPPNVTTQRRNNSTAIPNRSPSHFGNQLTQNANSFNNKSSIVNTSNINLKRVSTVSQTINNKIQLKSKKSNFFYSLLNFGKKSKKNDLKRASVTTNDNKKLKIDSRYNLQIPSEIYIYKENNSSNGNLNTQNTVIEYKFNPIDDNNNNNITNNNHHEKQEDEVCSFPQVHINNTISEYDFIDK